MIKSGGNEYNELLSCCVRKHIIKSIATRAFSKITTAIFCIPQPISTLPKSLRSPNFKVAPLLRVVRNTLQCPLCTSNFVVRCVTLRRFASAIRRRSLALHKKKHLSIRLPGLPQFYPCGIYKIKRNIPRPKCWPIVGLHGDLELESNIRESG